MTAIDRDVGGSTMIRIGTDTHDMLDSVKIIPQEPYNDCIKRLVRENQRLKNIYFTTQTKERMEADIKNFVLNPEVPATSEPYREIYKQAHPDETLTQDDLIHHVNGNHDDNSVENLKKVSAKGHGNAHAQMNKEFSHARPSGDIVGKDV
jgi:hypothetical protein